MQPEVSGKPAYGRLFYFQVSLVFLLMRLLDWRQPQERKFTLKNKVSLFSERMKTNETNEATSCVWAQKSNEQTVEGCLFCLPSDKWIKMQMDCSLLKNGVHGQETVILFQIYKNVKLHFLPLVRKNKKQTKTLETTLCIFSTLKRTKMAADLIVNNDS